jgi:hypothetical protein
MTAAKEVPCARANNGGGGGGGGEQCPPEHEGKDHYIFRSVNEPCQKMVSARALIAKTILYNLLLDLILSHVDSDYCNTVQRKLANNTLNRHKQCIYYGMVIIIIPQPIII